MKTNRKNEENKRNNKGFSLVELIVVIAIMAVLVAVLAPQFTKYVDRSRQSVDAQTVSGIVTAVQIGCADVTDYTIEPDTYTITLSKSAAAEVKQGSTSLPADATGADKNFTNAIVDSCGALADLKVTAKAWDTVTITLVVEDDYSVTISYGSTKGTEETTDFADYIGANGTASTGGEES